MPKVCFPFLSVNSGDSVPQFAVCDVVRWTVLFTSNPFGILACYLALSLRIPTHYPATKHNHSWPCSFVEHVCQLNYPWYLWLILQLQWGSGSLETSNWIFHILIINFWEFIWPVKNDLLNYLDNLVKWCDDSLIHINLYI